MTKVLKKRVLMLLQNAPYPQDVRVRNEAKALTSVGIQVFLVCPIKNGQQRHEILEGIYVYRFPMPTFASNSLGYIFEYSYSLMMIFLLSLFVFLRHGFDVVHTHCPPDAFAFIALFYKILGKRFVYDHHDLSPELYHVQFAGKGNQYLYQLLILLEKLSCRLANRVIATNQSYKKMEMERSGVSEEIITIVRNGPNLKKFQRVEPDPELRAKAGTLLGYVGTLGAQDGLDYLFRAIRHLIYDLGITDFFCVVIGTGSMLPYLKKLAVELQINDYVRLTGWISEEDKSRYLSTVDICVDPDPSNPFNDRCTMIKILEYMALGKPVVAFDLPEHRVSARDAAYYAKPNDELDFARQIKTLIDDPKQREKMGEIGTRRIAEGLSWEHQSSALIGTYEKLFVVD